MSSSITDPNRTINKSFVSYFSDNESVSSIQTYLGLTKQLAYLGNQPTYTDYAKIEKLRNFEPKVINKNANELVDVINATNSYWDKSKVKEPPVVKNISNVARVKGFMTTEKEYNAV